MKNPHLLHIASVVSFLALTLTSPLIGQTQQWVQVWGDEFDVDGAPDPAKWGYEIGMLRNNENQYYTSRPENVRVENGMLVIEAKKEPYLGAQYTSASIHTMSTDRREIKFDVKGGRLEVRAKMPSVSGSWAAFWTLGIDSWTEEGGWPGSGEIDVFEYVAHTPHAVFGNVHYEGTDGYHKDSVKDFNVKSVDINAPPIHEDFHVFRVDWYEDRIEWYFDAILYHSFLIDPLAINGNALTQPHYLILNLAVGGSWGSPIDPDFVSDQYLVDYVRVYELVNVPETAGVAAMLGGLTSAALVFSRLRSSFTKTPKEKDHRPHWLHRIFWPSHR